MPTRREFLGAGLAAGVAATAGCSRLRQRSPLRRTVEGRAAMAGVDGQRRGFVEDVEGPREDVELAWSTERGVSMGTQPLLSDSRLYVGVERDRDRGSDRGELAALDAATGEVGWSLGLPRPPHSPALVGGDVLVGAYEVQRRPPEHGADPVWTSDHDVTSDLGVADGRILTTGLNPEEVAAIDADDGSILWTHQLEDVATDVATDGDRTYVGTYHDELVAVAPDGTAAWRYDLGTDVTVTPAVADGVVVTGGVDFAYHGLRASDGERLWRVETGGPVYASPAVTEDLAILAGMDGTIRAVGLASGEHRWTWNAGDSLDRSFRTSPVTDGRTVYCGDLGGRLYAVDVETGDPLWERDLGVRLMVSPTIGEGHLFVVTPDGRARAFAGGGGR